MGAVLFWGKGDENALNFTVAMVMWLWDGTDNQPMGHWTGQRHGVYKLSPQSSCSVCSGLLQHQMPLGDLGESKLCF